MRTLVAKGVDTHREDEYLDFIKMVCILANNYE